jgi:predicted enzyme related to lactoylglutathione lyase
VKLSFRVDSIARAREAAAGLGGAVYGPDREWVDEAATVCDGYDPDGNVFQLFQPATD